MQVDHHYHSRFNGDTKERDIADPDRHAEVVAQQPLQNQCSSCGVESRKDQNHGFRDGAENHIQQHENYEEHNRQNDFQPFLRSRFKLVFTRPCVVVFSWQTEFLAKQI